MKKRGITLIEMIVVMALMSIIGLATYEFYRDEMTIYNNQSVSVELQNDGKMCLNYIYQDIRKSEMNNDDSVKIENIKDLKGKVDSVNLDDAVLFVEKHNNTAVIYTLKDKKLIRNEFEVNSNFLFEDGEEWNIGEKTLSEAIEDDSGKEIQTPNKIDEVDNVPSDIILRSIYEKQNKTYIVYQNIAGDKLFKSELKNNTENKTYVYKSEKTLSRYVTKLNIIPVETEVAETTNEDGTKKTDEKKVNNAFNLKITVGNTKANKTKTVSSSVVKINYGGDVFEE